MKVLWLCSWYPSSADPFDGDFIERHAKSLALYNHVDVIHILQNVELLSETKYKTEIKYENNLRAKIYYLPFYRRLTRPVAHLLFNLLYYFKSRSILRKYVAENGKPDIIHIHVPVKAGAIALWMKKKWDIPFIITEHNSAYYKHIADNYFDRNVYFRRVTKITIEKAKIVTSVSNWLIKRLNEIFKVQRSKVIRNGVDTLLFFPVNYQNSGNQFLHVSMMPPLKNIEGILKSLSLLNQANTNWQMQFIGPVNENYIQLSTKLGLDKQVKWTGAIPYTEVAKHMQKADALVHFSHYENLPCVVNEALCCGLPVLSSNVGGISELVNNSNGILVENGNTEQLANAMFSFLQNPHQFNKQKISKEATALFNYNAIGKQILEMYREVLQRS